MPSQAVPGRSGWENGQRVPVRDSRDDESAPRPERSALVMVRRLVGIMLADSNPALGIECMALVTGIGYEGASMADIARRHGVTRAAVSKRCVDLCDAFGVPPTRAMRPEKNRERCNVARLKSLTEPGEIQNNPFREAYENREIKSPMRSMETRERCRKSRMETLMRSETEE